MAIQNSKAREIAANWKRKKEKNPELKCEHKNLEKEYYLGTDTGDYVCTECGEAFTKAEKDRL